MAAKSSSSQNRRKPKTASARQRAANRRNSLKSTGPRTAQGKRRSAANGCRHGLSSDRVLVRGESRVAYENFIRDITPAFRPETEVEHAIVRRIVDALWMWLRGFLTQFGLTFINAEDPDAALAEALADPHPEARMPSLRTVTRFRARVARRFGDDFHRLHVAQAARFQAEQDRSSSQASASPVHATASHPNAAPLASSVPERESNMNTAPGPIASSVPGQERNPNTAPDPMASSVHLPDGHPKDTPPPLPSAEEILNAISWLWLVNVYVGYPRAFSSRYRDLLEKELPALEGLLDPGLFAELASLVQPEAYPPTGTDAAVGAAPCGCPPADNNAPSAMASSVQH